jgi:hypothetical protein
MTKGTHPKGICDLRKILHKAQVRLTQAGSLIIGYLRKIGSLVRGVNDLGNFYFAKTTQNRFRQIGRAHV